MKYNADTDILDLSGTIPPKNVLNRKVIFDYSIAETQSSMGVRTGNLESAYFEYDGFRIERTITCLFISLMIQMVSSQHTKILRQTGLPLSDRRKEAIIRRALY